MARAGKQPEPEAEAGAPEWMVTFSDCMTLLLTFFVLLLSFSSFDDKTLSRLTKTFTSQFPSIRPVKRDKSAFTDPNPIQYKDNPDEGSEKPTLAKGTKDKLTRETGPENFRDYKVFLCPSKAIFWGNGTVISFQGRKALSDLALFLKEVPNKVVVSENRQGDETDSGQIGLRRAWAVVEYFTKRRGLDKGQFSIAASTLQKNNNYDSSQTKASRMLEIVLLERSIYN